MRQFINMIERILFEASLMRQWVSLGAVRIPIPTKNEPPSQSKTVTGANNV